MGLLEIAVLRVEDDLAVKEMEDVNFEFGRKRDREPHAVRLRRVGNAETKTGHVGSKQRAYGNGIFRAIPVVTRTGSNAVVSM